MRRITRQRKKRHGSCTSRHHLTRRTYFPSSRHDAPQTQKTSKNGQRKHKTFSNNVSSEKHIAKFFHVYEGPYFIKESVGKDTDLLSHPSDEIRGKFHLSLLKPYYSRSFENKDWGLFKSCQCQQRITVAVTLSLWQLILTQYVKTPKSSTFYSHAGHIYCTVVHRALSLATGTIFGEEHPKPTRQHRICKKYHRRKL